MKLFLSSLAISNPQAVELAKLVGKKPEDIKLALDNAKFAAIIHGINDKLKADGYKTVPLGDTQVLVINGNEQKVI
jgi:hypothetical protein